MIHRSTFIRISLVSLVIALLFLLLPAAYSQIIDAAPEHTATPTAQPAQALYPVLKNGKWGYIDTTGRLVVQPLYDRADSFSEGLAAVAVDGKWGYIDSTGKFVIQPQYEWAFDFHEGLAVAWTADKHGWIDRTGNFVIRLEGERYLEYHPFSEGLAPVPFATENGVFSGYIDTTGKATIDFKYNDAHAFHEGLALVQDPSQGYGYIDKTGKLVIRVDSKTNFEGEDRNFSEGLASAYDIKTEKYGYIDHTGKFVIPAEFDEAYIFSEGLAAVFLDNHWSYIDKTGKLTIQPQFDRAWPFSEGLAAVMVNKKIGYIDTRGKLIIQPQYDFPKGIYIPPHAFHGGLAQVWVGDKLGYVDKAGKYIWEPSN
jgi:hypothetical protein